MLGQRPLLSSILISTAIVGLHRLWRVESDTAGPAIHEILADSECPGPPVGRFPAPRGHLVASVTGGEAGLRHLEVRQRGGKVILAITDDIDALLWSTDGGALFYAVSPVYGVPGIYAFNTQLGTIRRVIRPKNLDDPHYPDGTDYFVLCGAKPIDGGRFVLSYLHFPDVDRSNVGDRSMRGPIAVDTVSLP